MIGNNSFTNYQIARQSRPIQSMKNLKPIMGGKYPTNFHCYIHENPIFENYLTEYMEETQNDINE